MNNHDLSIKYSWKFLLICEFITNFHCNERLRFHALTRFTLTMALTVKIDTSQNEKK
jgi:hypothetical protein